MFSISCNNIQIIKCNEIIRFLAVNHNVEYIDLYSAYEKNGRLPLEETIDGLHLKPSSYIRWMQLLSDY